MAKINTEGNRVVDVFYVTEADGAKVAGKERIAVIRAALRATLNTLEASAPASAGAAR